MAKKRLTRKDLKQPDEFISLGGQALSWVREHLQLVSWVLCGILAVVLAGSAFLAYRAARERDANTDLARAMAALRDDDLVATTADLDELAERWGGTRVAPLGALLAANTEVRLRNLDVAIADFDAIQKHPGELPDYLRQQMLLAWSAALADKREWPSAAAKYQQAAQLDGPYTGWALLGQARMLDRAGDRDRARDLYQRARDEYPDLQALNMLASQLGR